MSHFKQVWLSFWRKDQGVGMIEAALFLPMFLMFAFAVIDFGNYLIVKNRIVSANTTIANAIRNNPTMSVSELNTVINNTLGDLVNPHTGIWVKSFTTPPTIDSVPLETGWGSVREMQNPWLADRDSGNDRNAYYVGIRVMRGVPWLTPLPRMLSLDVLDPENRSGDAPYGRKIADSFSFVTLNNMTCTGNQVLQSTAGGSPVCVDKDPSDMTCPSGQVVKGFRNGAPFCAPLGGNCIALEWFSGAGGSMLDTSMPSDDLLSDIANGRYGPNAYDYQPNRSGRTNLNSVFRGTAHSWCPQGWYMTALSHANDRGNTVDPYSGTPSGGYADDEDFRIWCCKLIN